MLVKNSATYLICRSCHLVNDTGILFSSEENAEHLQTHTSTHRFSEESDYNIWIFLIFLGQRSQKPVPSTFLNFIPDSWNCSCLQIFILCRPFNILKTSPLGKETREGRCWQRKDLILFSASIQSQQKAKNMLSFNSYFGNFLCSRKSPRGKNTGEKIAVILSPGCLLQAELAKGTSKQNYRSIEFNRVKLIHQTFKVWCGYLVLLILLYEIFLKN